MAFYKGNRPQFLDQMVNSGRLTPDGRDWLILALDPFHDMNHQAAGYPDADGSQTVVSCFQYQMDVSAPQGVIGNWDAHIYTLPETMASACIAANENADWGGSVDQSGTPISLGPLNITTVAAGASTGPAEPLPANYSNRTLPPFGNHDLIEGVSRVIGLGYEVTNTTAEMHKQGSVTSYRMPQFCSATGTTLINQYGGSLKAIAGYQRWQLPPSTAAEANLLKGTRTWDASAGVYATAVQNSVVNPLSMPGNTLQVFSAQPFPTGAANYVMRSAILTSNVNLPPSLSAAVPDVTQSMPFDTTGSIFCGLSNETTLTVKVRFYVERAPTFKEPTLSVLATPSAGYDVTALELYSHAISQLPVAVTVSENGLGDWFKGVLNVIKDVAGGATSLLGPIVPGAKQVGTSVQTILGTVADWIPSSKNKPKTQDQIVLRSSSSNNQNKQAKKKGGATMRSSGRSR
jgi:hypothetical protein